MVCIGTILKSYKVGGQFLCRLFSPLLADERGQHRLSSLAHIELRRRAANLLLELEELELCQQDTKILLKASAWQSPEQVKPYHGWELWVDEAYASPCAEGEFLYCELVGAAVYCGERWLGQVSGLLEGAAQLLLEVQLCPPRSESVYLPFHSNVIGRVQAKQSIEVLDWEYFCALLP